ncbi:hypothetical protein AB2N04_18555 [Nitratireductor sp. GISD-1A_MAKvit]|uniref:hypothetical protein n=1 Tax=Nitratireductor sp. GISD-1A_MAKvit TaxID=3234198 RepID=UPI003466CDBD
MRKTITATGALFLLSMSGNALAQEEERYRLERTEEGYVRMDTRTGAMTLCRERSGQLLCAPSVNERTAYEEDIAALQDRLADVEARLKLLEENPPKATSELPSDEEFEQTLGLMERFFRKFMGIVSDFEKDKEGSSSPDATAPERT